MDQSDFVIRRRHGRRHRRPVRTNRRAEIWVVASISVLLLGAGVSLIMSLAYSDARQAVTAAAPDGVAPKSETPTDRPTEPAVIIIQDRETGKKPPAP